jgi:putative ABC transport system permease protein
VVQDSHYESVRGDSPAQVFEPYPQFFATWAMNGYVRSSLPPDQVFALVRRAVREVDPTLPVQAMRTMKEQRDRSLATERVIALLASSFGALATLMAGLGLFGVLNYTVTRRTPEIGLRMALGAPGGSVAWLVLKEVVVLCGIGLGVALPAAMLMSRLVVSQLHGVAPGDPWTAAAAALTLAFVALVAAALPTRRAARVDPLVALRSE